MESQDNTVVEEETCHPQWVAHNHLFSFCTRTLPLPANEGGVEGKSFSSARQQCSRRNCLFRAKKT